jgi:hypothetical protein
LSSAVRSPTCRSRALFSLRRLAELPSEITMVKARPSRMMGEPLGEPTIINRCRKEDSYESRRLKGVLPESKGIGD